MAYSLFITRNADEELAGIVDYNVFVVAIIMTYYRAAERNGDHDETID